MLQCLLSHEGCGESIGSNWQLRTQDDACNERIASDCNEGGSCCADKSVASMIDTEMIDKGMIDNGKADKLEDNLKTLKEKSGLISNLKITKQRLNSKDQHFCLKEPSGSCEVCQQKCHNQTSIYNNGGDQDSFCEANLVSDDFSVPVSTDLDLTEKCKSGCCDNRIDTEILVITNETPSCCDDEIQVCDAIKPKCNDSKSANFPKKSLCAGPCCDSTAQDVDQETNIKVVVKEACEWHLADSMRKYLEFIRLGRCICFEIVDRLVDEYEKSLRKKCSKRRSVANCCAKKPRLASKSVSVKNQTNKLCCSNRNSSKGPSCSSLSTHRLGGSTKPYELNHLFARNPWKASKNDDLESGSSRQHVKLKVSGMTCTGCTKKVINSLGHSEGIFSVRVTFVTSTVEFDYDPNICDIDQAITRLTKETGFSYSLIKRDYQTLEINATNVDFSGVHDLVELIDKVGNSTYKITYDPQVIGARDILRGIPGADLTNASVDFKKEGKKQIYSLLWKTVLSAILTIPVLVLVWSGINVSHATSSIIQLVLATFVQTVAIPEFYVKALKSLIYSRVVEMDLLVVISITAAYVYSIVAFGLHFAGYSLEQEAFFETSTLLITLVLLGRLLAMFAKVRAVSAISMRSLQSQTAIVEENGEPALIDSRLLQHGDIFVVKPHAQVVTDGIIVEGESTVDESMITGESTAIRKVSKDLVIAGTLNGSSPLRVKLTRLPGDNSIADIAELVEKALAEKPKVQDLADAIAGYFVPVVIVLSFMALIVWVIVNIKLKDKSGGGAFGSAITYSIAVMAVSCPCALGLAVPMVLVVAGAAAARKGVLIKSSSVLERGCKITDIVFDKTGTLTSSALIVEKAQFFGDYSDREVNFLVHSMATANDHPMSVAILQHLKGLFDGSSFPEPVRNLESVPGSGIKGMWYRKSIMLGNIYWVRVDQNAYILNLLQQDHSIVCATVDGVLVAAFSLKAPLREEAKDVIDHMLGRNIVCHIVSGDNANTVMRVASKVGIPSKNVRYRHSPAQKQAYVLELMQSGKKVLFCGDGTNDAVAVAQATIGVTVGNASDITLATADVVLCGGLRGIEQLIRVCRRSSHVIFFNFLWAFIYNLVAISAAAGAFVEFRIPPTYAGVGEVISVLPVIFAAFTLMIG